MFQKLLPSNNSLLESITSLSDQISTTSKSNLSINPLSSFNIYKDKTISPVKASSDPRLNPFLASESRNTATRKKVIIDNFLKRTRNAIKDEKTNILVPSFFFVHRFYS